MELLRGRLMFEVSWIVFLAASLLVIISPGQDMVLVFSRGLGQGARAGVATAAGVSTGLLGHTVLAALGLGAILKTSATLFLILKFVGAGYLIYLGLRMLFAGAAHFDGQLLRDRSLPRLFREGALSNLSNPKVAVFYFAFLPQFVPAAVPHPTATIFALGVAFSLLTFAVKAPVGYYSGALSAWLRSRPAVLKWITRSSGAILIGLGLRLAFEKRP
jgi:threonine/homoserine/homoserine lactone efflux protein